MESIPSVGRNEDSTSAVETPSSITSSQVHRSGPEAHTMEPAACTADMCRPCEHYALTIEGELYKVSPNGGFAVNQSH